MLFKGTAELKAGEFSRRVAALGGRENAFTMRDATGYFQQIPAGKLEDVMKLEADRFANNRWPDDEFKRELEVVKEERRLRTEDQPRALMWETLNATVYQASPYRRPIVGWMSDLEAMTAQDARDFYKHWYVPGNATVVVAGDVDPQQVLRLAEKYYGRIPVRPVPPRKPRDEPEQAGVRRIEFKAPAEQSYVALAFKVPQLTSFEPGPANDDALALTVLAAVLDGYSGARLDRALTQGSDRVADSVGAGNGLWGRGPQLFTLDGVPAKGKTPEQVEAALRAEVAKVARDKGLVADGYRLLTAAMLKTGKTAIVRWVMRKREYLGANTLGGKGNNVLYVETLHHHDEMIATDLGRIEVGDWWAHEPISLANVDSITLRAASEPGGTISLRWDDPEGPEIGSLTAGKSADFIAVDLSAANTQPVYNVISHLAYAVNSRQVDYVWVAGRPLLAEGRLLTLVEDELRAKAAEWRHKITGKH